MPESMTMVTTASSMAKAEEKPRVMRVKKRATAQKLAPGISTIARGRVKKPTVKPPRRVPSWGHSSLKPTTP